MPPKRTNRVHLLSDNERGSTETMCVLIGRVTPSITSPITPGSVTPRVRAHAEIEYNSDRRCKIITAHEDPLSDSKSDHNEDTTEPNKSAHNIHEPAAPSEVNMEEMLERQYKMIDIRFQHNTELLERQGSLTSDPKDEF